MDIFFEPEPQLVEAQMRLLNILSQALARGGRWPLLARRILRALTPMAHAVEIGLRDPLDAPVARGHRVDPWSHTATERFPDEHLWRVAQAERRPIMRGIDHHHQGPEVYPWTPAATADLLLVASVSLVGFNDGYVVLHLGADAQGTPIMEPQCQELVLQMIAGAMTFARREARVAARCRAAHKALVGARRQVASLRRPWALEGNSEAIQAVLAAVSRVASVGLPATTLITGAPGTGRQALASHLHYASRRQSRPYKRLRCLGVGDDVLSQDLFGPEGLLTQPHGGTVVLEGVEALSTTMQLTLADFILQRVEGAPALVAIATTFEALRPELSYWLATVHIHMPDLSARAEDIPALVESWLARWSRRRGRPAPVAPRDVIGHLTRHPWPGHLPELEGALTRALMVGHGGRLGLPELGPQPTPEVPVQTFEEAVKACIVAALSATEGAIYGPEGAAARLGLNPSTLQSKMRKYGIRRAPYTR